MVSSRAVEAFENFVTAEQQLSALLQKRVDQDREMLAEMRRAGNNNQD